jgi:hypothetical protein
MLSTAILAWLHVFSAIGWLGGGIMFGVIIAPVLGSLSPPTSGEFLIRVGPRVARFFQVIAGLTILFGFLLLYNLGGSSLLDPSTTYGIELTIGVTFALLAFVLSEAFVAPLLLRAVRLLKGMQESGKHEPTPELIATLQRTAMMSTLTILLLILTSVFMVAAGFY